MSPRAQFASPVTHMAFGLCVYGAAACFSLSPVSHAIDLVGGLF